MRVRTWLVIALAVLTTAFLIINWTVFAAPAKFSLVFTSFEASVASVMLTLLALVVVVLAVYVGNWHGSLLLEYRRQAKELQAQRALADNAEASRFTAMGALMQSEIAASTQRLETALAAVREELRNTESSLAASLGEMDDRLQRAAANASPGTTARVP
jgi:hypothetical protein